jgi:hypothetical protein
MSVAVLLRLGFSTAVSRVRVFPRQAAALAVAARSAPERITVPLESADRSTGVRDVHGGRRKLSAPGRRDAHWVTRTVANSVANRDSASNRRGLLNGPEQVLNARY